MISATDITVARAGRTILRAPEVRCAEGSLHSIVGPSGCGKTTLLNVLGGLTTPDTGEVLVEGRSLMAGPTRGRLAFWRERAAFIFQDYGVIPEWNVAQNILLTDRAPRVKDPRMAAVHEVLETVGLQGRAADLAATLSGGERQRVGIARALARRAAFVFADEPTASLDPRNRAGIIELLRTAADAGACVITATHDEQLMRDSDELTRLTPPAAETAHATHTTVTIEK